LRAQTIDGCASRLYSNRRAGYGTAMVGSIDKRKTLKTTPGGSLEAFAR
jgi:hypothetical protein